MLTLGKASYWRNVNPTGAIADFGEVWRQAGRRRWAIILLSGMTTFGIFSVIAQEAWKGPPAKPQVTFINSWPADRSDAEIIKTNTANQKLQDRLAAEQAARNETVKNLYRTIGRASGMDVDAIERKAKADEAAEQAAEQKAIRAVPVATAAPTAAEPAAAKEAAPVGQP